MKIGAGSHTRQKERKPIRSLFEIWLEILGYHFSTNICLSRITTELDFKKMCFLCIFVSLQEKIKFHWIPQCWRGRVDSIKKNKIKNKAQALCIQGAHNLHIPQTGTHKHKPRQRSVRANTTRKSTARSPEVFQNLGTISFKANQILRKRSASDKQFRNKQTSTRLTPEQSL